MKRPDLCQIFTLCERRCVFNVFLIPKLMFVIYLRCRSSAGAGRRQPAVPARVGIRRRQRRWTSAAARVPYLPRPQRYCRCSVATWHGKGRGHCPSSQILACRTIWFLSEMFFPENITFGLLLAILVLFGEADLRANMKFLAFVISSVENLQLSVPQARSATRESNPPFSTPPFRVKEGGI